MSNEDIVRAWKDKEYRKNLSEEELTQLPESPAGDIELAEEDLKGVSGGDLNTNPVFTSGCCDTYRTCDFWKCAATIVIGPLCSV